MLKKFESKLTFHKSGPPASSSLPGPSSSSSPGPSSSAVREIRKKGKDSAKDFAPDPPSFKSPSLRQASMSSPVLNLLSPPISSPRSPVVAAASDPPVSPLRDRRTSIQFSSREVSPSPLAARRSSRDSPRLPNPKSSPLTSPSTPTLLTTVRRNPQSPESPTKVREHFSPPDTPTPASHRRQLSILSSQRNTSSTHLPGSSPTTPTPTPIRPRSPSRTRNVTPISRGLTCISTSNLPSSHAGRSPISRNSSDQHRRSDASPQPQAISPPSFRPRVTSSGSYAPNGRHLNMSTTSLCPSSTPEQREIIRSAISILCKELARPPPHISRAERGGREWEEVEVRMSALFRSQRMWGKGGGKAANSSAQLIASSGQDSGGMSSSVEEREKRLFFEALRDGYVLCQSVFALPPIISGC